MNLEKYQQYSRIARGLEQADLVLKDARIINVFTEEIIRGDIAIQDGIIAGIGSFQGKEERDLGGKYVCPGFIDSHLHLESTLVTPAELVTVASEPPLLLWIPMNLPMYPVLPALTIFWNRRRM